MPAELMSLAVREFGITIDRAAKPADTQSGAGVHPAWTAGGQAAYLKVTPASLGGPVLAGADPAPLKRALILEELAVFVFLWPPYAAYNSRAGIERVHDRARHLAGKWSAIRSS
jgi:hypothetical protein